jgi:hypothetical protein
MRQPSTITTPATIVKDGQVSANRNMGQKWEINLNKTIKRKYFTYFRFVSLFYKNIYSS